MIGASKIARDISARIEIESERARLLAMAQEHAHITERLNQVGRTVVSALEPKTVVQAVTDAATELTGAEFGAFFYNIEHSGGSYVLYALSGAPMDAFSMFPHPRATAIFRPTFDGEALVRRERCDAGSAVRAERAVLHACRREICRCAAISRCRSSAG